ncbi:hypothetical protein UA08_08342 [Talaromyces atroroseus]|uniref:Uncharacterized protein n=1 Tax=Talaromyces atroroseus TaxID=1441469 RepID=A0A225A7G8_TALAT|nr:hypothetical protein UA08_08342 [Talaromyces atroroseus]OKL56601.1 hypothetical protein UA08_08342 [Talaromyces atroroseus]
MEQVEPVEMLESRVSEALQNLAKVAEQLRKQGYNGEANRIGQLSIELVTIFSAVSLQLKEAQKQQFSTASNAGLGFGILPVPQAAPVAAEQTVQAPPPTLDFGQQVSQRPIASENTWARVASATKDQLVERGVFRVTRAAKQTTGPYQPIRAQNRVKAAAVKDVVELTTSNTSRQDDNKNGLLEDGKAGVVVLEGPNRSIPRFLSFVATRIHEGAIYDLSVIDDHKAIAVFQYALHAQIFVDRNTESMATRGESIFGKGDWTISLGQPLEWTDTLRRMCHPYRERRRLTFVKSRLIADHASYLKWVREVEDVAGAGNVDFVWAFNTGNATAVFFSVAVARKVMQTFTNWRSNRGCYEDLTVTYSSDPCEKELQLTTQLRYHVQPPHRQFEQLGPSGAWER